ncbi:16S rRNA (cytosine(967)-C(5))-methyltransferase RsmB [Lutibacter sp. B2]|nr:16S rRNA (cytosine(967)-C(5))-methyltransferase RsmB [Lutibacter sp. B2]
MIKTNARRCALSILIDVEKNNAFSNIAIRKHLKNKEISDVDKGLITELVYGVLENKIYLDFIIEQFSKIKMNKISIAVLNILRMGLYQIIYLDKIPQFAAVDESVRLAKKEEFKSSGFVNAILRNFIRNKEQVDLSKIKKDPAKYLSIMYSHPLWLVKRWIKKHGQAFTEELLKANNETPKLIIRTNTLKTTREELVNLLLEDDIKVDESVYVNDALYIGKVRDIEKLEAYKKGFFQVQDESSMLVANVLDPQPEECILDVCAAPGGKSTHIAQMMNNKGKVIARDIYDHKLKLINDNANRLGIDIIHTESFDATEVDSNLIKSVDRVLVDAPCSGLGIIRRKPELKYNKTIDDIKEISKLQYKILCSASQYVKKGGFLVYSTCTIEQEENMNIIEKFLYEHGEYEMVDINEFLPKALRMKDKVLQLYPNTHKTDGFFICKLKRIR